MGRIPCFYHEKEGRDIYRIIWIEHCRWREKYVRSTADLKGLTLAELKQLEEIPIREVDTLLGRPFKRKF